MPITERIRTAARLLTPTRKQPGTPPGTLIYGGEAPARPVKIHALDYGPEHFVESEIEEIAPLAAFRDRPTTTWVDVDGVHDVKIVEFLGRMFDIHPLTLEDIVSPHQRPKLEEYPNYTYVVAQMMHYHPDRLELHTEQVSFILMKGMVISFQESIEGDAFEPIRQRLRDGSGSIRSRGADYLLYSLLDVVVDHYMAILEKVGEHIDDLEDEVLARSSPDLARRITEVRRQINQLRRSIWPLRDAVLALERSERAYISNDNRVFFRDVYDHSVRTIELIESVRDVLATVTELHVSTLSFRMNEIMKVLTTIATFFLPLTFITGLYGMNFNTARSPLNMPELEWYYGYPYVLGLMVIVALGMFIYFRRRRWL